jgi:hypothetical protein
MANDLVHHPRHPPLLRTSLSFSESPSYTHPPSFLLQAKYLVEACQVGHRRDCMFAF